MIHVIKFIVKTSEYQIDTLYVHECTFQRFYTCGRQSPFSLSFHNRMTQSFAEGNRMHFQVSADSLNTK